MKHIYIDPSKVEEPTRDRPSGELPEALPDAKATKVHPQNAGGENASLHFVGTATTILEWKGIRIMTDPNFLHAGDHVHLGPGVTGTRQTNPSLDLHALPRIDLVLLSHYHADHFDQAVETSLRRSLPMITTPHAHHHLAESKPPDEQFTQVTPLDTWDSGMVHIGSAQNNGEKTVVPALKVTAMPGEHVPPGPLKVLNDLAGAVPPTNGWMLELGAVQSTGHVTTTSASSAERTNEDESSPGFAPGYRIYISGDTLLVDALHQIPKWLAEKKVDLMLVHLGGTTIPGPKAPLLMVTMDGKQGVELMRLVRPDVTVPVHFDDYDVFLSPLEEFRKEVEKAGLGGGVVYLDRGEEFRFRVGG